MSFEFDVWDNGRLRINVAFAPVLRLNGLTSFEAWTDHENGQVARQVVNRVTRRIELAGTDGPQAFYVKLHAPLPLKEYVKPLFRFAWPVHGALHEWNAILKFQEAGIPTMTPVVLGISGRRSLLVTQSLEGRISLLDWIGGVAPEQEGHLPRPTVSQCRLQSAVEEVARIARTMHTAGWHHQDFYLNHLLLDTAQRETDIRVIDLGRACQRRRLSARWIIKDLAQLDFSARRLPCKTRLRFLRSYLGRQLTRQDRRLIRTVLLKSQWIARHTQKHAL